MRKWRSKKSNVTPVKSLQDTVVKAQSRLRCPQDFNGDFENETLKWIETGQSLIFCCHYQIIPDICTGDEDLLDEEEEGVKITCKTRISKLKM